MTENPFFEAWNTPFELPPFDRIRPEHFPPAFDRGMAEHIAEIEGIAKSLQISVDTLREQAGMSVGAEEDSPAVVDAIREDPHLTGRQRQAMLEIYAAFTASAGRGARSRRSSGSSGPTG